MSDITDEQITAAARKVADYDLSDRDVAFYLPKWRAFLEALQPSASATVEQAIASLVDALAESKGWMRGYADSVIRDAIDRTAIAKPVIYIDETGALQSSLGSKETEAVLGPLVDHMRLHSATGAEPVGVLTVSRFRGHLENTSFDYTGSLPDGSYPLFTAPTTAQAEEPVDDWGHLTGHPEVEKMLRDCVPGGSSCDPQAIADDIRGWFANGGKHA